jgi:hypothetical protein
VDWRTPETARRPNATKDGDYVARQLPLPGKRPFSATLEVTQVLDMTPVIAAKLQPLLTICSGQEKIDPLLADAAMLRALFGGDDNKIAAFIEQRARGLGRPEEALLAFPEATRRFLAPAMKPAPGQRLFIVARAGALERQFEVTVCPAANKKPEPDLLSWRAL